MAAKKIATAADMGELTLMHLRTENVKKVRLVELNLTDGVTTIGGLNGAGKSSLLDSIKFALGGKAVMDAEPIRRGESKGTIQLDFGDGQNVTMKITSTLKRVGDDDFTSSVDIEIPGAISPTRVQDFLDKLAGKIAFDPFEFLNLKDAQQVDVFKSFVPFDFEANKAEYDQVFKQRTDVNRDQKREQAAADAIVQLATPPCERVDEVALTAELKAAGDHNAAIERRKSNRALAVEKIATLRETAAAKLKEVEPAIQTELTRHSDSVAELQRQIDELTRRIASSNELLAAEVIRIRRMLTDAAKVATEQADTLQAQLDAAGDLPETKDAEAVEAKLTDGREKNKALDAWQQLRDRKAQHQTEADKLSKESEELTSQLTELQQARKGAIEKASLPIDGLGIEDGYVTLKGFPFKQASTAQQVDASMAIAMALNAKIKVILIRNGSNLDRVTKTVIADRAKKHGYRVLMEVVDDTGSSHVVIEDGMRVDQAQDAA